jgi:hypothetical protein
MVWLQIIPFLNVFVRVIVCCETWSVNRFAPHDCKNKHCLIRRAMSAEFADDLRGHTFVFGYRVDAVVLLFA